MSVSNLSYSPSLALNVSSIQTNAPSSLRATSFTNQAVTGVLSMSGGDASGLSVTASAGELGLYSTQVGVHAGTFLLNSSLVLPSARSGVSPAMVSGVCNVACNGVTPSSVILISPHTIAGTAGARYISSQTTGAGFTITSTSSAETSTFNWMLLC